MNLNEKIEKRMTETEDAQLALYNKQLAHLDMELELREKLPMAKLEPEFEYENYAEWHAHLLEGLKLTVEEEKLRINAAINVIHNNRDEREELNKLRETR